MRFGAPDFPQPPPKLKEPPKTKCSKCEGECKTLSAFISECGKYHVKAVECLECQHSETLRTVRIGPPRDVDFER